MTHPSEPNTPSPAPQPEPAPAAPGTPPAARGPGGPPRPGGPRPGGPRFGPGGGQKPFPRSDRPKDTGAPPERLDRKDFAPLKPNSRQLDQDIEAELNAAMSGFNVAGALAEDEKAQKARPAAAPAPGGKKRGRVLSVHGKDVFIDVPGGRGQGVLPIQQFEGGPPKVGDEVEFEIERYDSANGLLVLTREGAAQHVSDWSSVQFGMIVEAKVTGVNKNGTGLMIEVNGIRGFMPISQADLYRVENAEQFVNQKLKCMVVELDPAERNLIVSRRALLERERQVQAEQFWATVAEGQVKKGIVRSVKPFGAFVDLGGADGLLPVSELSWTRVEDPNTVVKIGQTVEVMVNRVDFQARKLSLSMKQLVTSPWDEYAKTARPGARVVGTVTRTTDFGAFVELAPGIEGLIHISQLSTQRVRRVREVVQEGQRVEVEVQTIDPENRRIGLSLKSIAAEKEGAEEAAARAEEQASIAAGLEALANRAANPNLRGGIGGR